MAVKKEDPKRSRARLIGNVLLLIGAGLLIINIFLPNLFAPPVARVPYSLFVHEIEEGHVARVYIGQDQITYQLKGVSPEIPGDVISTTPIFDLNLPERLEKSGVEFAAAPVQKSGWFGTLLSWVIPPLIFVGIFQLFSRNGGGGAPGGLQIGKSKAKFEMWDLIALRGSRSIVNLAKLPDWKSPLWHQMERRRVQSQ